VNQQPTWEQIVRRRRALALIVIALLIWLVTSLVSCVTGGSNGIPVSGAGATCAPGTVTVTSHIGDGKTDLTDFAADVNPQVWVSVKNTGKAACSFDAGPAVTFFTFKSGEEVIWTSSKCDRTGLKNEVVTLQPGEEKAQAPWEWKKVYSSNGTCGDGEVTALPGSYTLSTEVNGVLSENYLQFQLQ
jgi:hypothetical protein